MAAGWQREQVLQIYASRSGPGLDAGSEGEQGEGAPEGPPGGPKQTALREPGSEDRSVLDAYVSATRDVPLLTKEEEIVLGREMRESRAAWAEALAPIPCAIDLFLSALDSATKGERPLTDAVLTPFGNVTSDDGTNVGGPPGKGTTRDVPPWRPLVETLREHQTSWRQAVNAPQPSQRRIATATASMARTLCDIEPAAIVLAEMLDHLGAQQLQIAALRERARARAADVAKKHNGPESPSKVRVRLNADERRRLEAIELHIGLSCDALGDRMQLARASQRRYDAARKHMVEANLRLAFHMARKLVGNGVAFEDLVQEAILGLMRAAEKFDPSLGYKFSTYASQWIWQGITRAVADGSRTIRVAAHMHDTIIRLNRLSRTLQQDLGREPTLTELATSAGLPEMKVRKALDSSRHPLSLDAPLQGFEDTSLGAIIEDEGRTDPMDDTLDDEVSNEVMQLLAVLPAREALILRLRHGIGVAEPYTLEEIGKVLGITRERTRQLEARAMDRLRHEINPELVLALTG